MPTRQLDSAADETQALNEYHLALTKASAGQARTTLLENGFLPANPTVLIDAGLRMLPTLEKAVAKDEAAGRLQAIISKLRISTSGSETGKAAAELERHLARYHRSDRVAGYWVMGIALGLATLIGWWIWG